MTIKELLEMLDLRFEYGLVDTEETRFYVHLRHKDSGSVSIMDRSDSRVYSAGTGFGATKQEALQDMAESIADKYLTIREFAKDPHVVVKIPESLTNGISKDLEAVLDYCQSDEEFENYCQWIGENGAPDITREELELIVTGPPEDVELLLAKVAKHKDQTHVWACAHRARTLLGE